MSTGRARSGISRCALRIFITTCFLTTFHFSLFTFHSYGAVSKSAEKQLETANTNQGGGTLTSSRFTQQVTVGEAVAGHRLSSSRFRLIPGLIGSAFSGQQTVPASELTIDVLYAKTDPLGAEVFPKSWQRDRDPIFYWEPPPTGPDVAGYSYAIDGAPDDAIDTTLTSFNVATSPLKTLADGIHTFSVKAINTAGAAGKPIAFELWVDTTAPQIAAYTPAAGALLNTASPSVNATISDVASGVTASTMQLLVNGQAAPMSFDAAAGTVISTGGAWREGSNSVELRVADAVGNAQTPLLWSVVVDTIAPAGSVTINGGATMTTSLYVTLNLSATDATSGVAGMLISNDALTGYVEEPYAPLRSLWRLNSVRGEQSVYVRFVDAAGNLSEPVADAITLELLAPETVITSGPAGFTPATRAEFSFMCPEGDCVFAAALDGEDWSEWSAASSVENDSLAVGNHYFRVKAAREANGLPGIQPDEEDPSPAERTWIVGVEPSIMAIPKGPPIKLWRLE